MELSNDFRVSTPKPDAWRLLTDVERIAPMLPGAQLQEVEGDAYRGVVKIKVGPITAQYKGTATFIEQDESAGKVVLKASGRDTRGQGNASATITAVMTPDGSGTKVTVTTDLTVTGKVAQFGRGVLAEVSGKLIGQFVDALEADLEKSGSDAPAAPDNAGAAPATTATATAEKTEDAATGGDAEKAEGVEKAGDAGKGEDTGNAGAAGHETTPTAAAELPASPRRIDSPEPEPVDLLATAGGSVFKRLAPLAGAVAAVVLVLALRRRRASRSFFTRK